MQPLIFSGHIDCLSVRRCFGNKFASVRERLKPAGRAVTHNSPLCYFVCWQYKKCRNLLLAVNVRILFRQVEGLCMIPTCHFHSKKGSQIYIIMINKRTAFPTILFFLVCQILHSKYILFESNKYSNENINTE